MNELTSLERYSKQLFGRSHALSVSGVINGRQIDPPEPFFLSQVSEESGVAANVAWKEFKLLEELGFVQRVNEDRTPGRVHYYVRVESVYWEFVDECIASFAADEEMVSGLRQDVTDSNHNRGDQQDN